jgi:hypothetical protein
MNGVDEATAWKMAQSQGQSIASLIMLRTQIMSQVRAVLSPEQQGKIRKLLESRQGYSMNDSATRGSISTIDNAHAMGGRKNYVIYYSKEKREIL